MAKTTIERLIDDLDGSEAQASITFALDGVSWSIDLNTEHERELRATLSPFLAAAAKVTTADRSGRRVEEKADKTRTPAIRAWALQEGVELPSRGRVASAVQSAYDARDVAALYAATGLEMEPVARRGRRRSTAAEFSASA